jgi:hypothetical protein
MGPPTETFDYCQYCETAPIFYASIQNPFDGVMFYELCQLCYLARARQEPMPDTLPQQLERLTISGDQREDTP